MSLPHLLLVDDSEAILAYERAALSGHYVLTTAVNGKDALEKIYSIRPDAVLLDLSMPEMDGDEVLARVKADPDVAAIPIIVITSEKERGNACLKMGAASYLPKPIRADQLQAVVARTLEQHKQYERKENLAVLFVGIGPFEFGLPLDSVYTVLLQPLTTSLPAGPAYLSELFELHGQPICVLDLAHRLGVEHQENLAERKMIVIRHKEALLAVSADHVRDPEEFAPSQVTVRGQIRNTDGPLGEAIMALVATSRGKTPVLDPKVLLSRGMLRTLPTVFKQMQQMAGTAGPAVTAVTAGSGKPAPAPTSRI